MQRRVSEHAKPKQVNKEEEKTNEEKLTTRIIRTTTSAYLKSQAIQTREEKKITQCGEQHDKLFDRETLKEIESACIDVLLVSSDDVDDDDDDDDDFSNLSMIIIIIIINTQA